MLIDIVTSASISAFCFAGGLSVLAPTVFRRNSEIDQLEYEAARAAEKLAHRDALITTLTDSRADLIDKIELVTRDRDEWRAKYTRKNQPRKPDGSFDARPKVAA